MFLVNMRVRDHCARLGTVVMATSTAFVLQWDGAVGTETYPQDTMMVWEA